MHQVAHPMSAASVRPRSAADCLIRCLLAGLLVVFPVLLTLLLPLCCRVAESTLQCKAKRCVAAPFRVPRLVVPPLALMLTKRTLISILAPSTPTSTLIALAFSLHSHPSPLYSPLLLLLLLLGNPSEFSLSSVFPLLVAVLDFSLFL